MGMKNKMTEKLYYEDVNGKTFAARVLSCEQSGGKYLVTLDRTAFFPEGGGQPADTGVLENANVLDVREHGGTIVHTVDKPVPAGSLILGGVNWDRRFRHMQQHTGEHIVSGIANRLFGADNVGFHMGDSYLTVDWDVQLCPEQLETIERLANEAVYRNVPVSAEFPSPERLAVLPYRSKKKLTGRIRIVTVPGYDVCACCGTHVSFTGEVGAVKITGAQNYKGGTRIFLVCGAQAMDDDSEKQRNVAEISALLSAKPDEISQAVKHLLQEDAELKRKLSEAHGELLSKKVDAAPAGCGNVCAVEKALSPDDLRHYALSLAKRCGGTAAVFSGTEGAYRYAVCGSHEDVRPVGKALNAALSGRGGGSKELVQGSVRSGREEIEKFFCSSFTILPE